MTDLRDIEIYAQDYRTARDHLAGVLAELDEATRALRSARMAAIRSAVHGAQKARSILSHAVADAPELFAKPKSRVLHGVRCGYRKAKDEVVYPEDRKLIELIRKVCSPEQAEALIVCKESPARKALTLLDEKLLRRLGIQIKPGADEVIAEPVDGDLEKALDALLGDLGEDLDGIA